MPESAGPDAYDALPLKEAIHRLPEELRAVGACEAWLRIRARVDSGACLHQLTALAGADAGIPKKDLSPERKAELRAFLTA